MRKKLRKSWINGAARLLRVLNVLTLLQNKLARVEVPVSQKILKAWWRTHIYIYIYIYIFTLRRSIAISSGCN